MRSSIRCGSTQPGSSSTVSDFDEVVEAVQQNNRNVGGGNIRQNSQMLLVHGLGRTANVEQIRNIVVTAKDGVPIRVQDVADVEIGHEVRRGAVTADGKGEVVSAWASCSWARTATKSPGT